MKTKYLELMKNKSFAGLMFVVFIALLLSSCEVKEDEQTPPEIPPYESMAIDFSNFSNDTKSTINNSADSTSWNYFTAAVTVGYWNIVLGVTLIVPVATFYECFNHKAEFLGDATWQWTYDVNVLGVPYTARMTGKVNADNIDHP